MSIETDFKSEFIFINSWNNTYRKKVNVIYPTFKEDLNGFYSRRFIAEAAQQSFYIKIFFDKLN